MGVRRGSGRRLNYEYCHGTYPYQRLRLAATDEIAQLPMVEQLRTLDQLAFCRRASSFGQSLP
jgi:hypothetical protein